MVASIIKVQSLPNICLESGVVLALGSTFCISAILLLFILMQCHWLLQQNVLTDIGLFQIQCLRSTTDQSEGVFLLLLAISCTVGLSFIALLVTPFWKVKKEPGTFKKSVLPSNWVYENNSENIYSISNNNRTLSVHSLRKIFSYYPNRQNKLPGTYVESVGVILPEIYKPSAPEIDQSSENSIPRLTSFRPTGATGYIKNYIHPCISSENVFSEYIYV